MDEEHKKPRRPDFVGFIRVSLWNNGDYASLHIGDMKIKLNKNDVRVEEREAAFEKAVEVEDVK